jgi:hypothetical protein
MGLIWFNNNPYVLKIRKKKSVIIQNSENHDNNNTFLGDVKIMVSIYIYAFRFLENGYMNPTSIGATWVSNF